MTEQPRHYRSRQPNRAAHLSAVEFAELVRLLRRGGTSKRFALFAVPSKGVVKLNAQSSRCAHFHSEYNHCFVGVYDARVRAGDLEDDLHDAGVRLVCSA